MISVDGNQMLSGKKFDSKYYHDRSDDSSRLHALDSYIEDLRAAVETDKQIRQMRRKTLERLAA